MRLEVEFTTEPFVGEADEAPAHAIRALSAATEAGLTADFGPLGTLVTGQSDDIVRALGPIVEAALQAGASRITLQVHRADGE
jgi:uncharacterized protein YqgV (UPF0045/DUF77 family)